MGQRSQGPYRHRYHRFWMGPTSFLRVPPTTTFVDQPTLPKEMHVSKLTLNSACSISSTGVSLCWPFFALPMAVRLAKVITTSSGLFSRMAFKPLGRAAELSVLLKSGEGAVFNERGATRNMISERGGQCKTSL